MNQPVIQIPVDLTNPGQFFACCGLLELADRLWPGTEGWFDEGPIFRLATFPGNVGCRRAVRIALDKLAGSTVGQHDDALAERRGSMGTVVL